VSRNKVLEFLQSRSEVVYTAKAAAAADSGAKKSADKKDGKSK
jgi:hypothetical protein